MLRTLVFLGLLLLLSACNPFVASKTEPPQLPEHYRAAQQDGPVLPARWWELFDDPELSRLQQEMLSGNLDLRQAIYRLEQLEALSRSSSASLWPSLGVSVTAGRERNSSETGGVTTETTTDNIQAALAASYEVDLWNRLHDKRDAASLRQQASAKEIQTLLLSLSAQLAESYFSVVEQRAQVELQQRQIERSRQLLTTTTDLYRAGLANISEVYQVQRSLASAEAGLPQLQTGLAQAERALALLLGRFSADTGQFTGPLPQLIPLGDAGLPASLLNSRPDIAAAFLQLQAADHELAAALAERLPTFKLSAGLGQSASRLASGDVDNVFWNLAASLAQPLFDAGRREAEVDRQQAVRNEQAANMQQVLIKAVQEVENALVADRNNALRDQQLAEQQSISQRSLELSRNNYRSGLISSSALLAEEIAHLNVLSQTISQRRSWLSSRITLARALGGDWMQAELEKQQEGLRGAKD